MPKSKRRKASPAANVKVVIRIGGGDVLVHPGGEPDDCEFLLGYAMASIVGGVRLTCSQSFHVKRKYAGLPKQPPVVERVLPAGVINFHVQAEHEEYGYGPSQYVARYWPIKTRKREVGDRGKWSDMRNVWKELRDDCQRHGYEYVPPPTLFNLFNVLVFFNYGTFSTDKKRLAAASNMNTRETLVVPLPRVDFEVPAEEELVVTVATPGYDGTEVVRRQEKWLRIKGRGVITGVEIGIEPLDPYAGLPLLAYEGSQGGSNDNLCVGC